MTIAARSPVSDLVERSNRLGADPRNTNYAGGNTSAKGVAVDPVTGAPVELLWVKGSGGDLGTLTEAGLAVLRLDRLRSLVDVYSGVDDHVLRRLDFNLELTEPGGAGKATFDFSITLGSVNEPQTVEAPSDAKPLQDLLDQLGIGDLGSLGLGGLGGAGGTGGSAGSSDQIQCLQQAQTQQELQACLQ